MDAAFGIEPSPLDSRVASRRGGGGDPSATRWTRRAARDRDRERLSNAPEGDESEDIDEDGNLINLGILSENEQEQEDILDANMQATEEAEINRAILLSLRDGQRPALREPAFYYALPSEQTAIAVEAREVSVGVVVEGPREEDIHSLEAMGFSRDKVVAALTARSNNIELAADHLLNGGEG